MRIPNSEFCVAKRHACSEELFWELLTFCFAAKNLPRDRSPIFFLTIPFVDKYLWMTRSCINYHTVLKQNSIEITLGGKNDNERSKPARRQKRREIKRKRFLTSSGWVYPLALIRVVATIPVPPIRRATPASNHHWLHPIGHPSFLAET